MTTYLYLMNWCLLGAITACGPLVVLLAVAWYLDDHDDLGEAILLAAIGLFLTALVTVPLLLAILEVAT